MDSPKRVLMEETAFSTGLGSPSPGKRIRMGGLFSVEGGGQEEDFNMFVEHALSPLGEAGPYGGPDSPSVSFNQRFQEPPLSTGGAVSLTIPTSNDWSPSVTGGLSVVASSEFKVCFNDGLSSSGLASPAHPPRMRHKKMNEILDTNFQDATAHYENNKQALASRMKDSYSGSYLSSGLSGERKGIAQEGEKQGRSSHFNAWSTTSPPRIDTDDAGGRPRRSGRSKTPTAVATADEAATSMDGAIFSGGRQRSPRSAMSVASSSGGGMRRATLIESLRATESQEFYTSPMGPVIRCNCKKSRCLKLYCECLHALKFCESCNCYDCENTAANAANRDEIIEQIRERNPEAFASKMQIDPGSQSKGHLSGCHCKKSFCLKKYCECFALSVSCQTRCRCYDCKNTSTAQDDLPDQGTQYAAVAKRADAVGENSSRRQPSPRGSHKKKSKAPPSPSLTLLELAGACQEQVVEAIAREGLLALSPKKPPPSSASSSSGDPDG